MYSGCSSWCDRLAEGCGCLVEGMTSSSGSGLATLYGFQFEPLYAYCNRKVMVAATHSFVLTPVAVHFLNIYQTASSICIGDYLKVQHGLLRRLLEERDKGLWFQITGPPGEGILRA